MLLQQCGELDPIGNTPGIASHSNDILAELCGSLVQGSLIASRQDDARAFFRKRERGCQTNPTIAAGDESDFSCKFL